jgi:sec-independent protein translocase protein TatA
MVAFGLPGGWEWIAILLVVLVLFGHRIPGMARSLGSGITEFKRGLKDGGDGQKGGSADGKSTPAPKD